MPDLTRDDLPLLKEVVLQYRAWRKAKGMEPSTYWEERIRKALEAEGVLKPKGSPGQGDGP